MTANAIVRINHLTVRYANSLILDDISFSVSEGEIFVILGESGCGKSTLLRHVIGLEIPEAGEVRIGETDIVTSRDDEAYKALRQIGVLFQNNALIGSMTIGENIALPIGEFTNLSKSMIRSIVRLKLSRVGLECYENHLPSQISGGMKKRAGLARALALNPKILFLDEPSAGLDPVTAAGIDELILHINKNMGTTIVIVTHELASIFAVAQRVIMLDKSSKKIIAEGRPAELRDKSSDPYVRQFFNRQARPEIAE